MKLSDIANVVDVEHDNGRLIEIGLTTVSIENRAIVQSYSLPIAPDFGPEEVSKRINRSKCSEMLQTIIASGF